MSHYCLIVLCFTLIASIEGRVVSGNKDSTLSHVQVDEREGKIGKVVPALVAQTLNSRSGIGDSNCPIGYIKKGGFCFEEYPVYNDEE